MKNQHNIITKLVSQFFGRGFSIRSTFLFFWTLCLGLTFFLTGPVGAAEENALTLVKDGTPAASIVIAKDATRAARFAAFELQHHLHLITRAQVPIVTDEVEVPGVRILVGESAATKALGLTGDDFDHQEYLIRFLPDTIVLMGCDEDNRERVDYDYRTNASARSTWPDVYDEQGTMYAVYDFLEKYCDTYWINPTDYGTVHPNKKTLTVTGSELRRKPFMLYRGGGPVARQGAAAGYYDRYQYGGGLWRPDTPEAKAYMNDAFPVESALARDDRTFTSLVGARNQLFQLRMKAGGDNRPCNHSFTHFYERFWYKDHKNFVAYHPEYFAQGYGGEKPPQLCFSNPATVNQIVEEIRDYFDHGGHRQRMSMVRSPGYTWGKNFYALEPMDNSSFCRCDTCTAQYEMDRERPSQHSTYWFTFVNKVAREIKKSHPDKTLTTLAYMTHEGLPTDITVEDNVAVYFCISNNRNPATNAEGLKAQLARLQQWRDAQLETDIYLWHYHAFPLQIADNGKFFCFPGFFAHELKKQFDYYRKLNVRGIFHCGFNGEVENYLTYKLMDDPSLDVDKLLEKYFAAYGGAKEPMKKWYDLAESRYSDPSLMPIGPDGKPYRGHQTVQIAWDVMGTGEVMDKLGELMKTASQKARGDARHLVKLWDDAVWSYMEKGRATFVERMKAPIPSVTAKRVPDAGGNPDKVDWDKAGDLGDKWYIRGGKDPSTRTFRGKVCHDGKYFYLELVEEDVTSDQLHASPQVFACDVWEPIFARQRAQPFRQYAVGPTGMTVAISYGEVNWRQKVKMDETGISAATDTSGNRWITRLSWPLDTIVDQPVRPGETLYMNVIRVSNSKLAGELGFGIDTWVSYCTVREVDRLGEVKLAE